ncbi:transposase [Micromonospora sp. 4G55]|nr:transposase [Micromonospora sp. 4G55]
MDRFYPSTRMCSNCGRINDKMTLNVRAWDCPCGSTHDRDVNAAMNVLAAGRAESLNACGAQIRPALVPAPREEAGIRPDAACATRSVEGISARPSERRDRQVLELNVSEQLSAAGDLEKSAKLLTRLHRVAVDPFREAT